MEILLMLVLKTIEDVQYFILLIGSRVGGFYDKKNRVTITQMEYRKAYEELKKGKLKIIICFDLNKFFSLEFIKILNAYYFFI